MKDIQRTLRTVLTLLVVALVVIGGLALYLAFQAVTGLHNQQLHICQVDNVRTAEDNASHWADYGVDSFVRARFTVPTKTETAAQKAITAAFEGKLQYAVAVKSWTPLVDCKTLVETGGPYFPAPPVPFTEGPPPASALSVENARLPSPVGGVL